MKDQILLDMSFITWVVTHYLAHSSTWTWTHPVPARGVEWLPQWRRRPTICYMTRFLRDWFNAWTQSTLPFRLFWISPIRFFVEVVFIATALPCPGLTAPGTVDTTLSLCEVPMQRQCDGALKIVDTNNTTVSLNAVPRRSRVFPVVRPSMVITLRY